jgi:hypothetical protein
MEVLTHTRINPASRQSLPTQCSDFFYPNFNNLSRLAPRDRAKPTQLGDITHARIVPRRNATKPMQESCQDKQ